MPNPLGKNNLGYTEKAYGEVQHQSFLQREAPMSGAPYAPMNAPRRAQRRATHATSSAPPALPMPSIGASSPTLNTSPAQTWARIASIPGISPLTAEYASRAQKAQ